jgi:hypothetical protein
MIRPALRATSALGRSSVFSAALWTTSRLAAVPLVALSITRRLAPPELRHLCDREAGDDELVALADQVEALQVQIDAAYLVRTGEWTDEQQEELETRVISPLEEAQLALLAQAADLRARGCRGYRARARMLIVAHDMLLTEGRTVSAGIDAGTCALMRDLTGRAA